MIAERGELRGIYKGADASFGDDADLHRIKSILITCY